MFGNVGGGGKMNDVLERQIQAIQDADESRKADHNKLTGWIKDILVQLRILNVHQESITGERINERGALGS